MSTITYEIITDGDIEICRDLCNELMAFQQETAVRNKENFDSMNFDTRMKRSFNGAKDKQVIVAKDNGTPVGYIFSTIDDVTEGAKNYTPDWAPASPSGEMLGFYPDWFTVPQRAGCLSNLYVRPEYKGKGIGGKLFEMSMEWLESFEDSDITFVYISNGNQNAYDFYMAHGFEPSHEVFGGFIQAAFKKKNK